MAQCSITMAETDFDSMLYRPVADGKEFEDLIPKGTCKAVASGKGDTDFSVKEMEAMVKEYSWQLERVAQILQTSSLTSSVENVKDFIYDHFQYKADKEDQLMRSPACSWFDRHNGIDCKSYSILASCLFTEMGILHYIRKIKQPGYLPTAWTHVYVIVPIDQENGNLKKGYYTVDGTLQEDYEPTFIEKSDLFMLQHYRLNAPASPNRKGLGYSIGSFNLDNLSIVKSLSSSITCLNTSFDANELKTNIQKINTYFNQLIAEINQAVVDKNFQEFSLLINEFYGNSKLFVSASEKVLTKDWNSCTKARIKVNIEAFKFYRDDVGTALTAWLNDSFTKSSSPLASVEWSNETAPADYGFVYIYAQMLVKVQEPLFNYTPKPKQIKAFEITEEIVVANDDNVAFDPLQFISGLSTVLASFTPTSGNNPTNPTTGQIEDIGNGNQPTTAGGGWIGWVLGLGALGFAINHFSKMPDKPANKSKALKND